MYKPSLEEAKALAADYKTISISRTAYADVRTPIEILKRLKAASRHCYMLESLEDSGKPGRYTFLGYDPELRLTCTDGIMNISGSKGTSDNAVPPGGSIDAPDNAAPPGAYIRQLLEEYRGPRLAGFPPFTGGLVGYFSYDYIKYVEPSLKLEAANEYGLADVELLLFEKVIAFDHLKQKIFLIVNIKTDDLDENYVKALGELDNMARLITEGPVSEPLPVKITSEFRSLFDKEGYCRMVEKAKAYIREGDIFQAVLSNLVEADMEGSLLDTYRVLRTINPSPYMFYFHSEDIEIAGSSPETLVKLENGTLYTFPLAGTRPRGKTVEEDRQLEKELLSDPKELAEHNMLVDLGRNDIGRISKFGSVSVERHATVQRFSHVMHIGSAVRGEILEGKSALDAIDAVLPAGTLSGAPKIRACQIIDGLEDSKRGVYGGAIGYIGFTGDMDTCIAIRMAFKKDGRVFIRSGAGIVADSVPENEYRECCNKAQAVISALRLSEGGIEI